MNYKELMEEYKCIHEEWKELPADSVERFLLEFEMDDIDEWILEIREGWQTEFDIIYVL
tara:strand:- start:72 stop:248 length:177 start_codon:yes stop_codon:yes gene_type:complete